MLKNLIGSLDWGKHQATIPQLLLDLDSPNREIQSDSYDKLTRIIVPWEIIEGYSSSIDAEAIIQLQIQKSIIPVLIYLLQGENNSDKSGLIQILHDLYRLGDIGEVYQYSEDKWNKFRPITQEIRDSIEESKPLFEQIANSHDEALQQIAKDLLNLIEICQ